MRRRRRQSSRWSTFRVGLLAIIALVVFTYLGFTKFANPFASPYTVRAIFSNAVGLRPDSLVRIAGVNVGKVTSIGPVSGCKVGGHTQSQCTASVVTMTIDDAGLPIHKDATFAIRPRIFLEGNFFIQVSPGSPSAPTAPTDYTFPIQQGIVPVQFDQVLTSLQADTRKNLQILLQQYGTAVKKAGPSYNASIKYWLPAYEYSAIVAHDALGLQPHDLSNWIDKQGQVAGALDTHPDNLKNLVTDFNRTAEAFAVQNQALQQAVAALPKTLRQAIPAFNSLNNAFPPLRQLARALTPGVQASGPAIDASLPFITQLRGLVQPSELQGLANDLSVTVPALARLTVETIPFMRNGVRPASSCVVNEIYPWSQLTLNDPHFNAQNGFPPHKVYVEAVDFLPGLAGESRDFDANGPYIRILGALGNSGLTSLQSGFVGGFLSPLAGFEPKPPPGGTRPPLAPNVPCETQPAVHDLSASASGPPPIMSLNLSSTSSSKAKSKQSADITKATKALEQAGLAPALAKKVMSQVGHVKYAK